MSRRQLVRQTADPAKSSSLIESGSIETNGEYPSSSALSADRDRTLERSEEKVDLAIETNGLKKSFGDTRAVDGVNLRIPRGSVFTVPEPIPSALRREQSRSVAVSHAHA